MSSALVLFSGGQDSTVCLAWALQRYDTVHTIGFRYDQKHEAELKQRRIVIADIETKFPGWPKVATDREVPVGLFRAIVDSRLLLKDALPAERSDGLPATFVPGRNLIFLLVAGIVAKENGIETLVGGMCETDYSGYPDCRNDTIKATETMLNLGLQASLTIETPLMFIDKAQTWRMAFEIGGSPLVNTIVNHTHTCYENDRTTWNEWGMGCRECAACKLRARGWKIYQKGEM